MWRRARLRGVCYPRYATTELMLEKAKINPLNCFANFRVLC